MNVSAKKKQNLEQLIEMVLLVTDIGEHKADPSRYATGTVIGSCMKRHRHQEFLRFLRAIDRAPPKRLDLPLIVDN